MPRGAYQDQRARRWYVLAKRGLGSSSCVAPCPKGFGVLQLCGPMSNGCKGARMRSIDIHAHVTPQCFWKATENGGDWHTLKRERDAKGGEVAVIGKARQSLP